MKKHFFSITLIILITYGLYAQDVRFGIRGGMNMASMTTAKSSPVSDDYKSRIAPGWGLFTEIQLDPKVSLRFGVEYSGMGGKKNGVQAMPTQRLITEVGSSIGIMGMTPEQELALGAFMGWSALNPYYYANVDNNTKLDYVMIPLLAQFGWDIGQSPWRAYVNAGPFASFLLSGKQIAKGTSRRYSNESETRTLWDEIPDIAKIPIQNGFPAIEQMLNDPVSFGKTNITGEMKSANFGIMGNVGIRYQCKRNFFFLEAGGNYGLFAVQQDDTNGSNRVSAISVMAGYAFSLF